MADRPRPPLLPGRFRNSGTACDGCLSAGGHGHGGYFYIDWNGAVSPRLYALPPVNVNEVYARGGTLNDVWNQPFFHTVRQWQYNYAQQPNNGLMPCPIRDHYSELRRILMEHERTPSMTARRHVDPDYSRV